MDSGETNWILTFVGQLVNFIILFTLLSIFVFKPLFKMLDERQQKIKEGVLKEEKAEQKLNNLREIDKRLNYSKSRSLNRKANPNKIKEKHGK